LITKFLLMVEFGTITIRLSPVRMRVLRRPISTTSPQVFSPDLDAIADPERLVDHQHDPADHVRERILGCQRDCQSSDPQGGKQSRDVDAETVHNQQCAGRQNDYVPGALDKLQGCFFGCAFSGFPGQVQVPQHRLVDQLPEYYRQNQDTGRI
jgi:hypothetical protein